MTHPPLGRGDVVLIPFPFTDLSGQIISPDPVGEDLLAAFISSVIPPLPDPTDYVLETTTAAFARTGLKARSVFRMGKLATLHRALVLRRLGRTTPELQVLLDSALRRAVGLT